VNRNSPLFIVKSNITWLWNKWEQIRKKMNKFAIIVLQVLEFQSWNQGICNLWIYEALDYNF
jgi:hypothetical protein